MVLIRFAIFFALALAPFSAFAGTNAVLKQVDGGTGTTSGFAPHVQNLAGLRSLQITPMNEAIRDGFATAGDAPALLYVWYASCPGTPDNLALYVQQNSGGPGCWSAASDPNVSNPKEWGAKCDNATLDQTTMQNALTAAEKLGISFPVPGKCVVSGLTINTPVKINGAGDQSQIVLASGSSAPAISIAIPSTAAGVIGGYANVVFEDMTITSPNRDDVNKAQEHGITATNGSPSVVTTVTLINTKIAGIPGDAIHATAFSGKFILHASQIILPGQNGFYCNSSTDTDVNGGEFYGAEQSNILLSGCANTKIVQVNEYQAQGIGVAVFNSSDVVFADDTIDAAGQHSINISNSASQTVTILGGLIRWSGFKTNNTYYDINSDSGNLGTTVLYGVHFPTPASDPNTNKPAGNIGFFNSSSAPIVCTNCTFDLGPIGTAGISNGTPQQLVVQTNAYKREIYATDYGVDCTGATDSTTALQNAVTAAQSMKAPLRVCAGTISTGQINIGGGIKIVGAGRQSTIFARTGATEVLFNINTTAPVYFYDLGCKSAVTATAGACISLTAPTFENQGSRFENIYCYAEYDCIDTGAAALWVIDGLFAQNYVHYGIYVDDTNNPDSGDSVISRSYFLDYTGGSNCGTSGIGVYQTASGGLKIDSSKFNCGYAGYVLSAKVGTVTSILNILNNSFESQSGGSIILQAAGAQTANMFRFANIVGNEIDCKGGSTCISIIGGGASNHWISQVNIENNTGGPGIINGTAGNFLVAAAGDYLNVQGNNIVNYGAAGSFGFIIQNTVTGCSVTNNTTNGFGANAVANSCVAGSP